MDPHPSSAVTLMERYAADTGLTGDAPPRRYLWSDAFAVCTWVGLGETARARAAVDRVHEALGRHREDDARTGWISGLPEDEGALHPTAGGLRIGKPLPERGPDDPYDPQLEWERDGQYFHYLTRWIRALERLAGTTGEPDYRRWAAELGRVAYERFSHGIGPAPNRLYWKMSIDLSRPLVPSMGQHDPLDGYVALSEVRAGGDAGIPLDAAIDGLAAMADAAELATQDPLGTGALLSDALVLARLLRQGDDPVRRRSFQRVVHAAAISLREIRDAPFHELPAPRRLAFRELGLAIGLAAADGIAAAAPTSALSAEVEADLAEIHESASLQDWITGFWLDAEHQASVAWSEHPDISTVMLATALAPAGYLGRAG